MAVEYFSFEKVLKELQMDEDELKRLVSEGQIRAFRDQDRMKFRADDIDQLKKGRQTEPTIILPPAGEESGEDIMLVDDDTDETLLDLDELGADDLGEADETAIPSLDLDDDDEASADTLTEELVFDEDLDEGDATDEVATQETLIDDDDDEIGMTTEPLDLDDDDDEEDEKPKTVIAQRRQATVRASATRASGRAAPVIEEEEDVTPGMVAATIALAVILFLAGLFFYDVLKENFNPISGKIAAIMQESFSSDGKADWFNKRNEKVADDEEEDMGDEGEGEEEPEEEEE